MPGEDRSNTERAWRVGGRFSLLDFLFIGRRSFSSSSKHRQEEKEAKMTEARKKWIREQARFKGIFDRNVYKDGMFEKRIPLSSLVTYDEEREFIEQVFTAGFDGRQAEQFEEELAKYMGMKHAVTLSSGEAALHLALRLAAEKLFGSSAGILTPDGLGRGGSLCGKRVFCSDLTTSDMVNPIIFEGGEPVFIDSSDSVDWSMDPEVLELAFEKYPDVKIVVMNHVYGFPGQALRIRQICYEHDALFIECAGEAIGAEYWVGKDEPDAEGGVWAKAGALGDYCVLDFGKGKMIGQSGGALLTRDHYAAEKARYWASGAQASTLWNQHEEFGYSCMMDELVAAMLRGQLQHIDEAIEKKKRIYDRYFEKLDGSMAYVIPIQDGTKPNYWITAMTCESNIRFMETRNDRQYTYEDIHGAAAPMEICEALDAFNAESRPVHKPMSMQPVFRNHEHFTLDGPWRMYDNFRKDTFWERCDMAKQYYESGICLPSGAGMTEEEQDRIIEIICACYDRAELDRMAWV